MKNLISVCLIGLGSLGIFGNAKGQDSLSSTTEIKLNYINQAFKYVHKDFSNFVRTYPRLNFGENCYLDMKPLNKTLKKEIKKVPKEQQLEFEKDYLKNAVQIMYKTNYKNYDDTLNLRFLDKIIGESPEKITANAKSMLQRAYVKSLMGMMDIVADNIIIKD